MAKKLFIFLTIFFNLLFAFSFVVLGDRTGGAKEDIFKEIISEIKLLKPDFVVNVGDLIEGYKPDSLAIVSEWKDVLKELKKLERKVYFCPGNHDIFSEMSEKIYRSLIGPTFYSFNYKNAYFVILDNSRFKSFSEMPKEMIDWLKEDLKVHKRFSPKFVFFHRPFWRYAYEKGEEIPLHKIFKKYGVNYVFSGHDHFYCYLFYDSIHYFQVGPSGSRYKIYFDESEGAFQNYLYVKVAQETVSVCVIKAGSILKRNVVKLENLILTDRIKKEGLRIEPIGMTIKEGEFFDTSVVEIINLFDKEVKGTLVWHIENDCYEITPKTVKFRLGPLARGSYKFIIKVNETNNLYPLPEAITTFKLEEKEVVLSKRLPLKQKISLKAFKEKPKIDGIVNEDLWQINIYKNFGDKDGALSPLKTEFSLGYFEENLYLAFRNFDTKANRVSKKRIRDEDVWQDDNITILLADPQDKESGYQITINPLGAIYDAKFRIDKEEVRRDKSWNPKIFAKTNNQEDFWNLELVIPFSCLKLMTKELYFNCFRYQAEERILATFQAPFSYRPENWAWLKLE